MLASQHASAEGGDRCCRMHNGHDFVIACFAILRAMRWCARRPMNLTGLRHYIEDSDAGWRSREDLFSFFRFFWISRLLPSSGKNFKRKASDSNQRSLHDALHLRRRAAKGCFTRSNGAAHARARRRGHIDASCLPGYGALFHSRPHPHLFSACMPCHMEPAALGSLAAAQIGRAVRGTLGTTSDRWWPASLRSAQARISFSIGSSAAARRAGGVRTEAFDLCGVRYSRATAMTDHPQTQSTAAYTEKAVPASPPRSNRSHRPGKAQEVKSAAGE